MSHLYHYDTSTSSVSSVIVLPSSGIRIDVIKPAEYGGLQDDFSDQAGRLMESFWSLRAKRLVSAYASVMRARADAEEGDVTTLLNGFLIQWSVTGEDAMAKIVNGNLKKIESFVDRDIVRQAESAGVAEAELAVENIIAIAPQAGERSAQVFDEVSRVTIQKMKGVSQLAKDEMAAIVKEGFAAGTDAKAVGDLIQARVGVSRSRARFVARNEMGNAYAAMTEARQTELGVTEYVWRTSQDERVRPEHAEKEGVTFAWAEPPPDTGHPGADYNCRCTAQIVLPD